MVGFGTMILDSEEVLNFHWVVDSFDWNMCVVPQLARTLDRHGTTCVANGVKE